VNVRVLIVDDQALVRTGFRMILEAEQDIEVVGEAADGVEAITEARRLEPDVVLMDVRMPELDGIEATRQIRALPPPRNRIPIIALTAHAMTGAREEYLAAGMDDFVAKPFEAALLLDKLARLPASGAHAAPVAAVAGGDEYGPAFDPARLETLTGFLRQEQLRDYIRLFLEFAVECAGRIAALAAAGDCDAMGREAHQLVGAAGNAGALEMCRLAEACIAAAKSGDEAACRRLGALLPPATERAAGRLRAWLADPDLGAGALLELAAEA
jgi:CheY-like chemotaxis protein